MKVGLEYEGVIRDSLTNKIVRWGELSKNTEENIIKACKFNIYLGKNTFPVDNYDCLAEVRTRPLSNPTNEELLNHLFSEIVSLTKIFKENGLKIEWGECNIPIEIHDSIVESKNEKEKKEKTTYTLGNQGEKIWTPSSVDKRRGGGLHINVSGLNEKVLISWVCDLHNRLRIFRSPKMRSHYRNQILYREKFDVTNSKPIFEYISFGFEILIKENTLENIVSFVNHQFHWAEAIRSVNLKYKKEVK